MPIFKKKTKKTKLNEHLMQIIKHWIIQAVIFKDKINKKRNIW